MQNRKLFCFGIHDEVLNNIKKLNYIPVGLGENTVSEGWLKDNSGDNISHKNKFYSELTFYYWLWKNKFHEISQNEWIGFCQYRRHWKKNRDKSEKNYLIEDEVIKDIPSEWFNYETILPTPINVQGLKLMKVLKSGKLALINNPKAIFKKNRNIKFNFDMMHGVGSIEKAVELLEDKDKYDFNHFINIKTSFSPANMFFCKNKEKIEEFFITLFAWLKRCENIFGFDLKGYGNVRIYAFLCERFLPYWFNKYTKVLEWPIIFHDLRNESINEK